MYLISLYFDENTSRIIQKYINQIAKETGNSYMVDKKVLPHITISSFETDDENEAIQALYSVEKHIKRGVIQWVTVGTLMPYVIYIAPVLNEYLHNMSVNINSAIEKIDGVTISKYYKPFQWLPHTTLGKTLDKEQMQKAFKIMQNQFGVFEGKVTKIGLAKTNPYGDIMAIELKV